MTDPQEAIGRHLDEQFAKMSPEEQKLVTELGTEWGEEMAKEQQPAFTLEDFLKAAPRKLRRKLQPDKKFGNTLLNRLRKTE